MSEQGSTPTEHREPETIPSWTGAGVLTSTQETAVLAGGAVARTEHAVIAVAGSGSVACLQGVLTNDIEAAGDHGVLYAALLTPKGMIVTDLWTARTTTGALVLTPPNGREPALQIFRRYFPPRLARTTDQSGQLDVLALLGPQAIEALSIAGGAVPTAATAVDGVLSGVEYTAVRPPSGAPFTLALVVPHGRVEDVVSTLRDGGLAPVPPEALEVSRIMRGWPRLGAEISE